MHPRKTIWYLTFILNDGFTKIRQDVGAECWIKEKIAEAYRNGVRAHHAKNSYSVYPPHTIQRIDVACREEDVEPQVHCGPIFNV